VKDISATVEKWKRNMLASVPTIKAGVMAVTVSPTEKAAQQADLYARKVQEAVDSGKYQANLRAVTLSDWQQATADKGTARINAGVSAAVPKVTQLMQQLLPFTERVKQTIAAMPKGSPADADARALAAIQMMRGFKFQRRG
jgi:predicted component of type VI protein secretion system